MSDSQPAADPTHETETDAPPMVAVYRHDTHKLRGRAHEHAADEVAGVRVNETIPLGVDRDAALLSRPRGEPEQTVDAYASPRRLSLLTGDPQRDPASTDGDAALRALVTPTDPEVLHKRWLTSGFAARFNESVFYPYTSLKYHTLVAAALLDNYRAGYAFDDLYVEAVPSHELTPHRTVLATPQCSLRITGDPSYPAARLGARPARSFGDVWAQLPACPFDTGTRIWRILDAQLRRITAWSTGLQYIEDYTAAYASTAESSTATQDASDDVGDEKVTDGGSPGWEVMDGRAATRSASFRVGVGASGGPGSQGWGCGRVPGDARRQGAVRGGAPPDWAGPIVPAVPQLGARPGQAWRLTAVIGAAGQLVTRPPSWDGLRTVAPIRARRE